MTNAALLAVDTATLVVSVVAIVFSAVALAVNIAANIVRRPRISVVLLDDPHGQPGGWVTVIARQRHIEVTEIGVLWRKRTWRRSFPSQWVPDPAYRCAIDARNAGLDDGQSHTQWIAGEKPNAAAETDSAYVYAVASGKVYMVRADSRSRRWLAGKL